MIAFIPFLVIAFGGITDGCSNIIVSNGASVDSSNIVAYNADAGVLYGSLYHYPSAEHKKDETRAIYDWDSGVYLGLIDEVPHTYNVVGNVNEKGLIIGETTFGGISALQKQSQAKMDYGSLIWVTLQRSATAREAISTIGSLLETYGYYSEGESFSIADQNEAWIMEIIGKGEYELGAVWVAQRVPDGFVTAHANQARIRTFALDDPENSLYAPDVIEFARKIGLYPQHARDEDFSFSDTYDPVDFGGARFCEARVWTFFSSVMGEEWSEQYLDYAQGFNLTNRMPLFVKPQSKISVTDTMKYFRNHYENSPMDMSGVEFSDVGAYTHSIFRSHPLTWSTNMNPDGSESTTPVEYFNERPIATPQTGWNFVAQSRPYMPEQLAALMWFGVDDAGTTVRFPIYGCSTKVPEGFAGAGAQDGVTPPMMQFSMQSAFYVFNLVANWAYTRWDLMYPEVSAEIERRETEYFSQVTEVDSNALALYKKDIDSAIEYVTDFGVATGNQLVKEWADYFGQLFVKYRDGYIVTANSNNKNCGCSTVGSSYPSDWLNRIVKDTGSHYAYPSEESLLEQQQQGRKEYLGSVAKANEELPDHLRPVPKRVLLERR